MDWGKFLEISNGSLMMMFMGKIPQRLLPYSKQTIVEALDIVSEHFLSQGNKEAVNTVEYAKSFLDFYIDDEEAIRAVQSAFGNESYLKAILPKLPERQKELLDEIIKIVK